MIPFVTLIIICIAFVVGCGQRHSDVPDVTHSARSAERPSPWPPPVDSPHFAAEYRNLFTRVTVFEKSGLHWNQRVRIFVNQRPQDYFINHRGQLRELDIEADEAMDSSSYVTYTPGTIFLKEHYTDSSGQPGSPLFLAAMLKHGAGYDSAGGDWEYLAWTTTGAWVVKGDSRNPAVKSMCASCHLNMSQRDFIFATFADTTVAGW